MQFFFKNIPVGVRAFMAFTALAFFSSPVLAQMRYGFKTGLTFASIDGPLEVTDAGATPENWNSITSFHIGITVDYLLSGTPFGIRGEVLYNQKGSKYTYDGESFRTFRFPDGTTTPTIGNSRYLINVTNAYIDIPVMFHGRWKDFELSAGAYAGLLVQSIGEGSLAYTGGRTLPLQLAVSDQEFILDHDYGSDKPGAGASDETVLVQVGGKPLEMPKTFGAYFDNTEDRGSLYSSIDYGLVVGLNYYVNNLYFGFRMQYGLADISNMDVDVAKSATNNGNPIYRDDKDRNMIYQASVGFSF